MAAVVPSVTFNNAYKMPIIGLGTAAGSSEAVEAALDAGYRHIDTAFVYRNEAAIGEVLKKWLDSGRVKREELFIVTKLPHTGNSAETYLKKSLEALQLSYVDLYLIHTPVGFLETQNPGDMTLDMNTDHVSVWKAMEAQVDAGRTRSIGLSNFNSRQIKRIMKAARIPPANLQVELNVYFQQKELVAFCNALDITVCAFSPLRSPGLSENPKTPLKDPVVLDIAKKHGKTTAQILLRHLIENGIIVIPKSTNPARVKENFQVFDFQLDKDDMKKLDELDEGPKGRSKFGGKIMERTVIHPEYPFSDPY